MIEIRFPEDQQEGTEATVTRWLVAEGDPWQHTTRWLKLKPTRWWLKLLHLKQAGLPTIKIRQDEEANPGDVLCTLSTDAAQPQRNPIRKPIAETPETGKLFKMQRRSKLSPAVRQRVAEHQLDLSGITGSGRDGRITLAGC